jgi:hypothetical protein
MAAAQLVRTLTLHVQLPRVPYGSEEGLEADHPCHDCLVGRGQFHVLVVTWSNAQGVEAD